jgi:hypothetical protein
MNSVNTITQTLFDGSSTNQKNIPRIRDLILTKESEIFMTGRLEIAIPFSNNIYTSKSGKSKTLPLPIFNV